MADPSKKNVTKRKQSYPVDVTKTKQYAATRQAKGAAWTATRLLNQSPEKQAELSQLAWRELDVLLRKELRSALRKKGADALTERGIKDLTMAASTAAMRAYPDQADQGLQAHVPAKLLKCVSEVILKSVPQHIDVTPIEVTPETVPMETKQENPQAEQQVARVLDVDEKLS